MVWVGGLTLALGGFFLVAIRSRQGLLGPGVRVLLGGLFALALLAAGEWTRRKESLAAIEPLPIANIPAILTAAGTAVAFATVYAAYALYDFLVPAAAFILLGMVALGTLAAALLHGPALAGLGIVGAFVTPMLVSSEQAGFLGAVYLSRHRHRGGLRRWRASGCGAGSRSPPSCSRCSGPSRACNAGRRWSARTHSMSSPDSSSPRCWWCADSCSGRRPSKAASSRFRPARSRPICSARPLIVLDSFHADTAMIVFALLVAGTLFVAWRAEAAAGAIVAAARSSFVVFAEWAVRANPDMLVLPGGPLPGIGPHATDGSVSAASDHRRRSSQSASAPPGFWRRAARSAPSCRWYGRLPPCSRRWRC